MLCRNTVTGTISIFFFANLVYINNPTRLSFYTRLHLSFLSTTIFSLSVYFDLTPVYPYSSSLPYPYPFESCIRFLFPSLATPSLCLGLSFLHPFFLLPFRFLLVFCSHWSYRCFDFPNSPLISTHTRHLAFLLSLCHFLPPPRLLLLF